MSCILLSTGVCYSEYKVFLMFVLTWIYVCSLMCTVGSHVYTMLTCKRQLTVCIFDTIACLSTQLVFECKLTSVMKILQYVLYE